MEGICPTCPAFKRVEAMVYKWCDEGEGGDVDQETDQQGPQGSLA